MLGSTQRLAAVLTPSVIYCVPAQCGKPGTLANFISTITLSRREREKKERDRMKEREREKEKERGSRAGLVESIDSSKGNKILFRLLSLSSGVNSNSHRDSLCREAR